MMVRWWQLSWHEAVLVLAKLHFIVAYTSSLMQFLTLRFWHISFQILQKNWTKLHRVLIR